MTYMSKQWHHQAPSDSLISKTMDLDTKIVIMSGLVQKLWKKTEFCNMMANVTCLDVSHVHTT